MTLISKITALMCALNADDFARLPPAQRRRFADLARYVASMAEPKSAAPKTGVIAELQGGRPG